MATIENTWEATQPVRCEVNLPHLTATVRTTSSGQASVWLTGRDTDNYEVDCDGRTLTIRDRKATRKTHFGIFKPEKATLELKLPEHSRLTINAGMTTIAVDGALDRVSVNAGTATLRSDSLLAATNIQAGTTKVEVGDVEAGLTVASGTARVALSRVREAVKISGGVVRVADIDDLESNLAVRAASGTVVIRRAHHGTIKLAGAAMKATIGAIPGVPVFVKATGIGARVNSTLDSRGEPVPGQPHLEVIADGVGPVVDLHEVSAE